MIAREVVRLYERCRVADGLLIETQADLARMSALARVVGESPRALFRAARGMTPEGTH